MQVLKQRTAHVLLPKRKRRDPRQRNLWRRATAQSVLTGSFLRLQRVDDEEAGTVVGQERWPGTLMSEKVRRKQAEYNTWLETRAKETSLSNIRLVPQYPRQFLVVGANGALSADHAEIAEIRVPRHIELTGVLDLDTLAIGYYKSAIEWAELCKAAGADNQGLTRPTKEEDFKERTPAAFKPALVWQLGRAYADLDRLRYFLSGVTLYTSAGKTYDAVGETEIYEASLKQLKDSADAVQSPETLMVGTACGWGNCLTKRNRRVSKMRTVPSQDATAHIDPFGSQRTAEGVAPPPFHGGCGSSMRRGRCGPRAIPRHNSRDAAGAFKRGCIDRSVGQAGRRQAQTLYTRLTQEREVELSLPCAPVRSVCRRLAPFRRQPSSRACRRTAPSSITARIELPLRFAPVRSASIREISSSSTLEERVALLQRA